MAKRFYKQSLETDRGQPGRSRFRDKTGRWRAIVSGWGIMF